VSQVNRATGETMRQQATQEGLVPLKAWVKNALDHVIQECMAEPGLEFVWVGDDAVDPLEQAQTLQILVGAGIKTREEARADLGLAPAGGGAPGKPQAGLAKLNPHRDERGLFTTADNAAGPVGKPDRKPQPTRIQVASLDNNIATDATVDGGKADQAASQQTDPRLTSDNTTTGPTFPSSGNRGDEKQPTALVDLGTLVGKQDFGGGITICTYRSNVFGHYFQRLSDTGDCPATATNPD